MEWKIGEIRQVNGEWYQCVVAIQGCRECSFRTHDYCTRHLECLSDTRSDKTSVIFKKLEKVGEPITVNGKNVQLLKTTIANCDNCAFYKDVNCDFTCYPRKCHGGEEGTYVEIKQTKEDMEEKKIQLKQEDIDYLTRKIRYLVYKTNDYDRATEEIMNLFIPSDTEHSSSEKIGKNLKPFNLETAKQGKPVCTRDGRKARIICFDMNSFNNHIIVALITEENGTETIYSYTSDGKWKETKTENDLMMLPEKKEGWAKIRKDINLYDTKEEADRKMIGNDEYVTAKVCWEEQYGMGSSR